MTDENQTTDPELEAEVAANDAASRDQFAAKGPRYDLTTILAADTASKRVDLIEAMMRSLMWEPGKSGPRLAVAWGVHKMSVQRYAAESWRRVKKSIETDVVHDDIMAGGRELLTKAVAKGKAKDFAVIADVLMNASGIGKNQQESPPAKVEITVQGPSNGEPSGS